MARHLSIAHVSPLFGLAACISAALSTTGCFAVTNLDRFHEGDEGDSGGPPSAKDDPTLASTLDLTLKGMGVHLNQTIEFRIIDSNNFVQSRGVVEPLDAPSTETVTFTVPNGIPAESGPYRLDFYADVNGSHSFDGLKTGLTHDHAWRIEPLVDTPAGKFPHVSNVTQVIFNHNTLFVDIREWPKGTLAPPADTGLDVAVHFPAANMSEYVGKLCQVRVSEARGHTVGLYRIPQIPAADFVARIAGVVEAGAPYNVDVYIDANGNGKYDSPLSVDATPDLGWRFSETAATLTQGSDGGATDAGKNGGAASTGVGIELTFDPAGKPGVTDVGPP